MQMPTTFSSASFGRNCTLCVQPLQAMLHRHTLSVFIDLPLCVLHRDLYCSGA